MHWRAKVCVSRSPGGLFFIFGRGEFAVSKICGKSIVILLICGYALACFIGSGRVLQAIARSSGDPVNTTFERGHHATSTFIAWNLRKQNITEPRIQAFFSVLSFLISSPRNDRCSPSFDFHPGSSLAGLPHFFPLPRDYPASA